MARTKGSINQNIHFKTREAFDIHLLYDEKKLLSGENPPAFWFQRLIELSNNPPYVIAFREPTKFNISSFNLADYIDEKLKVKTAYQAKHGWVSPFPQGHPDHTPMVSKEEQTENMQRRN